MFACVRVVMVARVRQELLRMDPLYKGIAQGTDIWLQVTAITK